MGTRDFDSYCAECSNCRKLPFQESDFHINTLKEATCIWFTSSTKGVAPVKEVINFNTKLDLDNDLMKQCQILYQQRVVN